MSNETSLERLWDSLEANERLTRDECAALRDLPFSCRTLAAGDPIERPGESSRSCSILITGFAYCGRTLRDGGRQIVAVYVPGDFLGLGNLFQPDNTMEARMLTPGDVATIAASDLASIIHSRPAVQSALWRQTAIEAAVFSEWLTAIGRRDAQGRIAHLLCEFAVRLRAGRAAEAEEFVLPLTQAQLADATGLTAVHVNRVLCTLRESGLVELDKHSITINDWAALVSIAEFDRSYLGSEFASSS